ncbi:saccharopine dehydrogenase family protein [Streptomyces sp. NPDC004561]
MSNQKLMFIGAAGEMAAAAIRGLAQAKPELDLVLADINTERLQDLVDTLPNPKRITMASVDLFDARAVAEAVAGATLVVNGAGPFMRTTEPVLRACIAAGCDYLDYSDDAEAALAALDLSEEVAAAGIGAYPGVGLSPGYINVLAADAASELDQVEEIELGWYLGDEGKYRYGDAALSHWVHAVHGEALSWRNGQTAKVPAYVDSRVWEFADRTVRIYECAHPEVVTLPRKYPEAREIRIFGGLAYGAVNGIFKGVGQGVDRGEFTAEESVLFLQDLFDEEPASMKVWPAVMRALAEQVAAGEVAEEETQAVLAGLFRGEHEPYSTGWAARATGLKDGQRVTVERRSPVSGPDTVLWSGLGQGTGLCAAAGALMLLEDGKSEAGVFCPEDWIQMPRFFQALTDLGVPRAELLDGAEVPVAE